MAMSKSKALSHSQLSPHRRERQWASKHVCNIGASKHLYSIGVVCYVVKEITRTGYCMQILEEYEALITYRD